MDQRNSIEESVNFWLKQARGERVGAFITRVMAGTCMPIIVGGGLNLIHEGRIATGTLLVAGGALGFIGLHRFAKSEELEALSC